MLELVDKEEGKYLTTYLSNLKNWNITGEKVMKFDAIVSNPPYQEMDGGHGSSSKPTYQKFVKQAKLLEPKYISMIIPARWYTGGKGLDKFRDEMIHDTHMKKLYDYLDGSEIFPTVEIKGGICYFLWDNDYDSECEIVSHEKNFISKSNRYLAEKNLNVFIRYNQAIPILRKVFKNPVGRMSYCISARNPFGFGTNYNNYSEERNDENSIVLYRNGNSGFISENNVKKNHVWIKKWKILTPKAIGEGNMDKDVIKPIISEPNSVCTDTYLVFGVYDSREEAENVCSYIQTKFFHFMVGLLKNTQDAPRKVYNLVPIQDFSKKWTDKKLYEKYDLDDDEIAYIEERIWK